uniref:Uncharacterized protein n=2 Tax=Setaria viridis TaxID=4556 RepID=A0A4U6TQV5_SETVI|nr:uncharacterized protein LOC117864642 [Setaria viridis]TKW03774.1 hypothetical protein SEVIR_7G065200v2 [Setaria viridis]
MDGVQGEEESLLNEPALSPEAATIIALVLGNDDLLREVLLHLSLPTSLVHAACVCKRWLRVASGHGFLRDFRSLHPPRLLGYFPNNTQPYPKLLPCNGLPTELEAASRHANTYLSRISKHPLFGNYVILDIRNGRMLVSMIDACDQTRLAIMVCTPLQSAPPVHLPFSQLLSTYRGINKGEFDMFEFLPEDGGDGLSYYEVRVMKRHQGNPRVILATVVACEAGVIGECRATEPMKLPKGLCWSCCSKRGLLCGTKFYLLSNDGYILGLDLVTMTLFYINLPEEVEMVKTEYDYYKNVDLSRGEGSNFYLIYLKGFHIRVWIHDAERGSETSNWVLVDTISLLKYLVLLRSCEGCRIHLLERSGDNAEFVYLRVSDTLDDYSDADYLLLLKSRAVEDVSENHWRSTSLLNPFMMVWPPTFPALNEEDDHGHVGL